MSFRNRNYVVALCCLILGNTAGADPEDAILARVAGEPVTIGDLRRYAQPNPIFYTQLQVPRGPRKVLDNLIAERLLVLEGERRGIPRPPDDPGDVAYAFAVRDRLEEPCPAPDQESVAAFYKTHLDRFSTPVFVRVSRLALPVGDDPAAVFDRARELKAQIERGGAEFARLAEEVSVDPLGRGRGGDLGFQAVDPEDPVLRELAGVPAGAIYGPARQDAFVVLYLVTDRREPVPEPFETARDRVAEEQLRQCKQDAFERVLAEAKAHWPVEIYAEEIDVRPQPPPPKKDPAVER